MSDFRPCAVCKNPSRINAKYWFGGPESGVVKCICVGCYGDNIGPGYAFDPHGTPVWETNLQRTQRADRERKPAGA
jgi:hypothetical protein